MQVSACAQHDSCNEQLLVAACVPYRNMLQGVCSMRLHSYATSSYVLLNHSCQVKLNPAAAANLITGITAGLLACAELGLWRQDSVQDHTEGSVHAYELCLP